MPSRRADSAGSVLRTSASLLTAFLVGSAVAAEPEAAYQLGRRLFTESAVPACAACHTLKEAGTEGNVGPVLDELKPDATRVAKALRNGIGQMPSYQASLTDAEIEALAQYVATAVQSLGLR